MIDIIINKNISAGSIYPLFSGYEKCRPSHRFGPYTRDYHIIHFCISGKGELTDKYGTHKISAGELFIIRNGEITVYAADEKDPWEYAWIAFIGDGADIFSTEKSVYPFPFEFGEKLKETVFQNNTSPYIYTALIYELMDILFCKKDEAYDAAALIKRYIDYISDTCI